MNKLADRSNLHEYRTIAMHRLAALAAAPDYHRVLFENERVRVLDTRRLAGEQTPVHAPRIARSALCRELDRLHPPRRQWKRARRQPRPSVTGYWGGALDRCLRPHSVENTGAADLHIIGVEIKGLGA